MNSALTIAAILLVSIGFAHSYLGERYILIRLFRRSDLPKLLGSDAFTRSRAKVVTSLADSMRAAGVAAMVFPTMPFNAPRAVDKWPDICTALGYGNWLGLPEVSVPAGLGADGMPALNLSVVGLPNSDARVLALAHAYERQSRRFVAP